MWIFGNKIRIDIVILGLMIENLYWPRPISASFDIYEKALPALFWLKLNICFIIILGDHYRDVYVFN